MLSMKTRRRKNIREVAGYFHEDIHRLGQLIHQGIPITIENLGMSRGRIQEAYKGKKEAGFEGDIFTYLAWIEMRLRFQVMMEDRIDVANHLEPILPLNQKTGLIVMLPETLPLILWKPWLIFDTPEFEGYVKMLGRKRELVELDVYRWIGNTVSFRMYVLRGKSPKGSHTMNLHKTFKVRRTV